MLQKKGRIGRNKPQGRLKTDCGFQMACIVMPKEDDHEILPLCTRLVN